MLETKVCHTTCCCSLGLKLLLYMFTCLEFRRFQDRQSTFKTVKLFEHNLCLQAVEEVTQVSSFALTHKDQRVAWLDPSHVCHPIIPPELVMYDIELRLHYDPVNESLVPKYNLTVNRAGGLLCRPCMPASFPQQCLFIL